MAAAQPSRSWLAPRHPRAPPRPPRPGCRRGNSPQRQRPCPSTHRGAGTPHCPCRNASQADASPSDLGQSPHTAPPHPGRVSMRVPLLLKHRSRGPGMPGGRGGLWRRKGLRAGLCTETPTNTGRPATSRPQHGAGTSVGRVSGPRQSRWSPHTLQRLCTAWQVLGVTPCASDPKTLTWSP